MTENNNLITIGYKEVAESSVLNHNFKYLDNRANALKDEIDSVSESLDNDVDAKTQEFLDSAFYNVITISGINAKGTISLVANKIYAITPTDSIRFNLPIISDFDKFYQILVQLNITDVDMVDNKKLGTDNFFDNIRPKFLTTGSYDMVYEYDNTKHKWTCGVMRKGDVL